MHSRNVLKMGEQPTVHVFVPVYNEERYLEATLKSLQSASDYYDERGGYLNVTVSNNCSTDGSLRIIKEFAKKNSNWEIRNTEKTLSGDQHFNKLIQSCRTKYICIIGAHDLISRNYFHELEICLDQSIASPLVFCKEFVDLNGTGENAQKVEFRYDFSGVPSNRFWQSIYYLSNATCIQGMIETKKLQSIHAFESQVSDLVWLHGLLKFGKFTYNENASYIRTNPIRPSEYTDPKVRKLKSGRTAMQISLLRTWTPPELSMLSIIFARIVIALKFSTKTQNKVIFQIIRKLSQSSISPATRRKETSSHTTPIGEIISN